jgi:hypothetical protein
MHYGMPRRSGRYPFGSGKRPFQSLVEAHQKKKAAKEAARQKKREYAAKRKFRRNMTKEEKQEFINNLKLEREVKQLVDENLHPGRTAAKKMIADVGQRAIKDAATDLATKSLYWGVGKLINEASDKPNTSMPSLSEYLYGKNEHREDTSDATRKMLNKAMKDAGISDKTIKALGAYTNNKVTKQVQEQLAQKAAYWQMANEINKASGGTYENMPSLSEYMFGKNEHKQVDDRDKVRSAVKKILKDANANQNTIDDVVNEFMDRLDDEENKAKHSDLLENALEHKGIKTKTLRDIADEANQKSALKQNIYNIIKSKANTTKKRPLGPFRDDNDLDRAIIGDCKALLRKGGFSDEEIRKYVDDAVTQWNNDKKNGSTMGDSIYFYVYAYMTWSGKFQNKAKHSDNTAELYHRGFTRGNSRNDAVIKAELLKAANVAVSNARSTYKHLDATLPSDKLSNNLNPFKGRTKEMISGFIELLRESMMQVLKDKTDYTDGEINQILTVAAANVRSDTDDIDTIYREYPIQVYNAYVNYER